MQYGNLHPMVSSLGNSQTSMLNIGDPLQMLMIQSLYDELGIVEDRVLPIHLSEIKDYDGEEVINSLPSREVSEPKALSLCNTTLGHGETLTLPLNFGLIYDHYYVNGKIKISDKIRPVFLAVTLATLNDASFRDTLFDNQHNIDYLQRFSPIGCRDEYTLSYLSEHGIPAYLNGCLTATLERRNAEQSQKADKVYFVDAPESLSNHIPKNLFDKCVFKTHQYYVPREMMENINWVNQFVREQYQEYREQARLVVTSRLHAAAPCLAMGIPVILAMDIPDYRYSWLEKLTPLYTPEHFDRIQWEPICPQYESTKASIRELAKKHILGDFKTETLQKEINAFFQDRPKKLYTLSKKALHENTAALDRFAESHWHDGRPIRYALWGLTSAAEVWLRHIECHYPFARLETVIDSFEKDIFCGLTPQNPDILTGDDDLYVIVIASGAVMSAKEIFKKIKKPKQFYCLAAENFLSGIPSSKRADL